jgi:glutamate dehydrogenase/leucine dehydrogenase
MPTKYNFELNYMTPVPCEEPNPYQVALRQLEIVAEKMKLDPDILEVLKYPKRTLEVAIPVRSEFSTMML